MALAVAQACKIRASSGTTVTVTGAWTPAAGSLLHGAIGCNPTVSTTTAMSGSVNGSFTKVGDAGFSGGATGAHFYKANSTGGLEDLTATGGSGSTGVTGIFHEVTGAHTTAPFTTGENAQATYTLTTNPQTGSVTNSVADSIFFAFVVNEAGAGALFTLNSTGTSPTGWALKDATNSQEQDGSTYWTINVPFLIVSSSAATVHGWATDNVRGVRGAAAFRAAVGGTPALVPTKRVQNLGMVPVY